MAELLRVTQVLKPFSGYGHIPQDVLDKAADRGTRVHCACNAIIQHLPYPEEEDTKGYIESFHKWEPLEKHITLPKRFEDKQLGITGECDGIWFNNLNQEYILYDIKTSAKEGKTWGLQVSAYAKMAKDSGYEIHNLMVVQLDKNGKKPKTYNYNFKENWLLFLSCFEIYKKFFLETNYMQVEDFL